MKEHHKYKSQLQNIGNEIIRRNKAITDTLYPEGSIKRFQYFLKDYGEEIEKIKKQIITQANLILEQSKSDANVNFEKLKQELTNICQDLMRNFLLIQ